MRAIRYLAAIATIVMSLLNLPFAFDDGGIGLPTVIALLVSLLGVLGIVAAIGLLRSAQWAVPAVVIVGAINLVSAIVALLKQWDGAVIGLVLSIVGTGLAVTYAVRRTPATASDRV